MFKKVSRRCMVSCLQKLIILTLFLEARSFEFRQEPTRVPGSDHFDVRTEFPYEYWRPTGRPFKAYTSVTRPSQASSPASYGFYYGDSNKDLEVDASSWQILPIQLPDDLVGAVNERATVITTTAEPAYPTVATPQYGRHPGVTEKPHLFHPERLYKGSFEETSGENGYQGYETNWHHYPNHRYSGQGDAFVESYQIPGPPAKPDWLNDGHSILDQVHPIMADFFPQIPKLPKFPTIPKLPPWPFGDAQSQEKIPEQPNDAVNDVEVNEQQRPHRLYPIPGGTHKRRRGHKRPLRLKNEQMIILSTPPNQHESHPDGEEQIYENYDNDEGLNLNADRNDQSQVITFPEHHMQYIEQQIRPMLKRRRPFYNRRRPLRRKYSQNRPMDNNGFHESHASESWEAHVSASQEEGYQSAMLHNDPGYAQVNSRRPISRYRPHRQNPSYQQQRPNTNRISGLIPEQSPLYPQYPTNQPTNRRPTHPSHFISQEAGYDYDIIDRLSDPSVLTPSVSVPGGLIIVALALALFYFNFVWYPTPVVTARLIKILSDSIPDDVLDSEKQRAIGEVYEVFRNLETEYVQDPDLWKPSCKSRLVCQVHQELPALWPITHTYEAAVRRSLATGPTGAEDLTAFLEAAHEGSQGSSCDELFNSCPMPTVPVRSYLQTLLGMADGQTIPTVVYS